MVATRAPETLLLAKLRALLRESEVALESERRRVAAASFGFNERAASFLGRGYIHFVPLETTGRMPFETPDTGEGTPFTVTPFTVESLLRDDAAARVPDAIVLQAGHDSAGVLERVLPEIRARSHLRQASVLVLHAGAAPDVAVRALNLGAAETAQEDSSTDELIHRIDALLARKVVRDALHRSTEESFRMATTDVLTGLYNRRYSEVYLADVLLRARESGRGITVMMVDIDHFKAVNDGHGHAAGDAVLAAVARRIRDNLRAVDLVSRHGGEEFLVVMPDIEGPEAELAAERLRAAVSGRPVRLASGEALEVTVSVGVAMASVGLLSASIRPAPCLDDEPQGSPGDTLIGQLLESADRALYCAKDAGRNCVSVSPVAATAA